MPGLYKNYNDLNQCAHEIGEAIIPPRQEVPAVGQIDLTNDLYPRRGR